MQFQPKKKIDHGRPKRSNIVPPLLRNDNNEVVIRPIPPKQSNSIPLYV
jgi:hypothetical protein